MEDTWGIGGFRVGGGSPGEVNRNFFSRIREIGQSRKIGCISFDLKWSKSHWEGHQTPLRLKNRSKDSQK